jgi:hypothetical protein
VGNSSLTQVFDGKILSAKIRYGLIAGKWGGGHLESHSNHAITPLSVCAPATSSPSPKNIP